MVVKINGHLINTDRITYISDVDVIDNPNDFYKLCRFEIHFSDKHYLYIQYKLTENITTLIELEEYTNKIREHLGTLMNNYSGIINLDTNQNTINLYKS